MVCADENLPENKGTFNQQTRLRVPIGSGCFRSDDSKFAGVVPTMGRYRDAIQKWRGQVCASELRGSHASLCREIGFLAKSLELFVSVVTRPVCAEFTLEFFE